MISLIDDALVDAVCAEAAASPRRRKNRNFHPRDDHPGHRLLNALMADTYIPPHRHLDPNKDETYVVLRGRLAQERRQRRGIDIDKRADEGSLFFVTGEDGVHAFRRSGLPHGACGKGHGDGDSSRRRRSPP